MFTRRFTIGCYAVTMNVERIRERVGKRVHAQILLRLSYQRRARPRKQSQALLNALGVTIQPYSNCRELRVATRRKPLSRRVSA